MRLLASREYPVIDYQTMAEFIGHERLFRAANGDAFLLHMSSDWTLAAEERIIWLTARDAISWLNEAPEEYGMLGWIVSATEHMNRSNNSPRRTDFIPRSFARHSGSRSFRRRLRGRF
jgi:hypothetical protein